MVLVAATAAACSGPTGTGHHPSLQVIVTKQTESMLHIPQIPPVQLGKVPPGTHIRQDDMPYFGVVAYCEHTTRKQEKLPRGPLYETCADDQMNYRSIIGQTINAGKFQDADIIRCAKASRTAYQGEWFCLNGEPF